MLNVKQLAYAVVTSFLLRYDFQDNDSRRRMLRSSNAQCGNIPKLIEESVRCFTDIEQYWRWYAFWDYSRCSQPLGRRAIHCLQLKLSERRTRATAKATLVAAMDSQIKTAGSEGNLDLLKTLTSQKDTFESSGILPDTQSLKDAVARYTDASRKADGELVSAYETAIDSATPEQAMMLRKERARFTGKGQADKPRRRFTTVRWACS